MSALIERLVGIATLQGLPTAGYRRYGVPPGGAFDLESMRLANALAGNEPGALTIELSNAAVEFRFSTSTRIAVVGAEAPNRAIEVPSGHLLSIPVARSGLRSYVAVKGGWIPDGIDSTLARSGKGLSPGDWLEHADLMPAGRQLRLADPPDSLKTGPIRILPGPQPVVSPTGRTWTVSNSSDRTGIRLEGMETMQLEELTSEPACVGAVQVTSGGQLIVIGPDGPTIAGYPKVAVVCSADLDRLAHLRPGQQVDFEEIGLDAARVLAADRESRIARIEREIRIADSYA